MCVYIYNFRTCVGVCAVTLKFCWELTHACDARVRRTVRDKQNEKDVVLTDAELAIIQRIQDGKFPDASFDPYEVCVQAGSDGV